MKVNSIVSALLLLVGVSFAGAESSPTAEYSLADCKSFCNSSRQQALSAIDVCKPALKHHPVPKLFNACVEGRKRSFDQNCIPICTQAELSVTSYDACQSSSKHGAKFVDWCRKGYDNIVQKLDSLLVEHSEKLKQDNNQDLEKESAAEPDKTGVPSEPVESESELGNTDSPIQRGAEEAGMIVEEDSIADPTQSEHQVQTESEEHENAPLGGNNNIAEDDSKLDVEENQAEENSERLRGSMSMKAAPQEGNAAEDEATEEAVVSEL